MQILGFRFQGMWPKYQPQLAQQLAQKAADELFSFSSIKEKAAGPDAFNKLKPEVEKHIDHFLKEKLKESFPMLSMFIGDKTIGQLKNAFLAELESLFPVIMNSYLSNLEKDFNPRQLIAEKIGNLSFSKADLLMNKTANTLFTRLQLSGLVIGLMLGLVQAAIYVLLIA